MPVSDKPIRDHMNHCPSCGIKSSKILSTTVYFCRNCGIEIHFSPVTSAAALIEDPSGNVLFIKRKKAPEKGKLGIPGGFLNPGESLEEALVREVKEEVGLELNSWSYLGGWPNEYSYNSVVYSVTDIYFIARVKDFAMVKICSKEVVEVLVAHPREVDPKDLAFPSLKTAVSEYLKIRYSNHE